MPPRRSPAAAEEQLRLMVKVARLYHEHGVRQPEIARRLHVSQARVSRLLKQAEQDGIVRTTVVVPEGVQTALEEQLEARFGLREAVVVEALDDTEAGLDARPRDGHRALPRGLADRRRRRRHLLLELDAARRGRRHAPAAAEGRGRARAAAVRRRRQPRGGGARGPADAALRRPHRRAADVPARARRRRPRSTRARRWSATGSCARRWTGSRT